MPVYFMHVQAGAELGAGCWHCNAHMAVMAINLSPASPMP
jgi:hypothetical protein